MVQTQSEARQFFIDKIVQRARTEDVDRSDDERRMLSWSEVEPDSVADPELPGRLASAISDEAYESKIAGLVRRAFDAEGVRDPQAQDRWRQAWSVLHQGDHYLLIMIDRAIGTKLKPW
jgi:hypothetical protein